jgi:DnaJ-domain-containing protein 1
VSGVLFIIILIVVIPIVVIGYIVQQIQYANEGSAVFSRHIPEARARFLLEVFGLQADDLKMLHFDGYYFHLKGNPSFKDLKSVSCVSDQNVSVVNPALPHTTTWRHTRKDGGPDRRYSNNPQTMTSRRFTLCFNGLNSYTLTTYGAPYYYKIEDVLKKFNILFEVSAVIDLEEKFKLYEAAFARAQTAQTSLNTARTEKSKADSALAASRRLSAQAALSGNLLDTQNNLTAQLRCLNSEITRLQQEVTLATNEIAAMVQNIRLVISQCEDLKTVRSYGSTGSSWKASSSWGTSSTSSSYQQSQKQQTKTESPAEPRSDSPYSILNVSPSATMDEITAAYRKMAQMYHPDKVAGLAPEFQEIADKRMKAINAAYKQLRNEFER